MASLGLRHDRRMVAWLGRTGAVLGGEDHSHSIVNSRALFIGKHRASWAGDRPDTDISTVAAQRIS